MLVWTKMQSQNMPMKHYCNLERVLLCHLLLVLLPRQPHHRPQVATSCHLIPVDQIYLF